MRARIDQLYIELSQVEELRNVHVAALGPTGEIPSKYPYVNITPARMPRTRTFLIGADPEYEEEPQIRLWCWQRSTRNMRDAFDRADELANDVHDVLHKINARTTLNCHYFTTEIEDYIDAMYENWFLYGIVILMTLHKTETHED
jgi:hypothetical protein